jgi:hypothetical protein
VLIKQRIRYNSKPKKRIPGLEKFNTPCMIHIAFILIRANFKGKI